MSGEPGEPPDLLAEAERLMAELQHRHGEAVAAQTTRLLEAIDAVHRAGLTHLLEVIRGMGGDAFVNRLIADPAIRILLMSYDLVPVDRRLMAEEALDEVRGHLHAHGVDVEILDVVGGVVYVRLHGLEAAALDAARVMADLERALRSGFIGFQEIVARERSSGPVAIPIGGLRRPHRPVYRDVLDAGTLAPGGMTTIDLDGTSVLVVRAGDGYHAVVNRCGDSPLPLEYGAFDGAQIVCSWHGCRYDVRTGARTDGLDGRLRVLPLRVEAGRVLIAAGVAAVPRPED